MKKVEPKPFTILHTIETAGPGGAETVFLELASKLDPVRFRSIAMLPGGHWLPKQLEERQVEFSLATSGGWYDPSLVWRMARIVQQQGVELIHSHLADQNFYSCLVGHLTRRKIIVTYHGSPHLHGQRKLRQGLKSWIVSHSATYVVVVSNYLKRLLEDLGFPPERVVKIHNGVDLARFGEGPHGHIRAELGLATASKLVGMVANFRRSKGYEYFVRAARRVADCVPEARFLAVGETDPEIERKARDLVRDLRLHDRFLFLGFRADIPSILRDLDVFVLSSTDEGLSIATIEAMAASKPVVVTRSGGPEEVVDDGRTGFLVPPADAEAIAARVIELLQNAELAGRLGRQAQAEAQSRFSLGRMLSEYQSLYEKCLKRN